jgi:hypothetical protein
MRCFMRRYRLRNKYKVTFTGEKVFFAENHDHAEQIAEKYLSEINNPINMQLFSIGYANEEE